MYNFVNKTHH